MYYLNQGFPETEGISRIHGLSWNSHDVLRKSGWFGYLV